MDTTAPASFGARPLDQLDKTTLDTAMTTFILAYFDANGKQMTKKRGPQNLSPEKRVQYENTKASKRKYYHKNKQLKTPNPPRDPEAPMARAKKRQRIASGQPALNTLSTESLRFNQNDDPFPSGDCEAEAPAPDPRGLSPPETCRHPTDYVSLVRGYELSENAPGVTWADGTKTVLPFIPDPMNSTTNLLVADEDAVRRFSSFPESRKAPYIVHLSGTDTDSALTAQIREHLSNGRTVVIDNAERAQSFEFSAENISKERKHHLKKRVCVHHSHHRVEDVENPQRYRTLEAFFDMVSNPVEIGCILDLTSSMPDGSRVIAELDHGHHARQGMEDLFSEDPYCLKDTQNTRNWELLHTGGFHTFEHHDAEGYATFLRILTGCKMWGIARPAGYADVKSRAALDEMNKSFIRGDGPKNSWRLKWEENGGEIYTITAEPGSLVIMPPGVWHLVYTPVRTLATGGHIYMYDTLHLTEAARWFDREHALEVTNTSHISAYDTLCMLACNLARVDDTKFFRKPIQALCRMILKWREYLIKNEDSGFLKTIDKHAKKRKSCQIADVVANYLAEYFDFDLEVGGQGDYLFDGKWLEPGPVIDLETAMKVFEGTAIRPRGVEEPTVSLEQIIERDWTPLGGMVVGTGKGGKGNRGKGNRGKGKGSKGKGKGKAKGT